MTQAPYQATNEDLEAYIDGLLDAERTAEIEAQLRRDPKLAEMVRAMRFQNDALRCLGADILKEPIPERLRAVVEGRKAEDATGRPRRFLVSAAKQRLA